MSAKKRRLALTNELLEGKKTEEEFNEQAAQDRLEQLQQDLQTAIDYKKATIDIEQQIADGVIAQIELHPQQLARRALEGRVRRVRILPLDEHALRWRYVGQAVVFEVSRVFPVPFDQFIETIDVAKTIQYMNDYLGGIVVPVAMDEFGRVTHQAERNLYLPQPNYLVLAGGDPIDVTKLEHVQYGAARQRMSWRTIKNWIMTGLMIAAFIAITIPLIKSMLETL